MYACSSLLKMVPRLLLFILISFFMIICEGKNNFLSIIDKNYCPFIETLSFGSDIHIKCNNSYLIFNEINNEVLNWKFADQKSGCNQENTQKAFVNQCGISRLGQNYLKVPLKSLGIYEQACIYCRINYKPIAPVITAFQSDGGQHTLYTINITATGLAYNESFEILWAKRLNAAIRNSYNYWFLQKCIDPVVKILENTAHTIRFVVDDIAINRVEFIIRRCDGACRKYDQCSEQGYVNDMDPNYLQTPDSIEKISCDSDCLNGIIRTSTPAIMHHPRTVSSTSPTTIKTPLNSEQKLKLILLIIALGLLVLIILVVVIRCARGKKPDYAKTSNVDPDEHK